MRLKTGEASFNIVLDGNTITKANRNYTHSTRHEV